MARNRVLFIALAVLLGTGALADEASKKQKLAKLVDVLGYREMFAQKIEMQKEQSRRLGRQALEEMTRELSLGSAVKAKLEKAYQSFSEKTASTWTAEQMASAFGEIFGAQFGEAEIDELVRHYNSELGKKEALASKRVLVEFTSRFQKDEEAAFAEAVQEYTSRLDQILGETKSGSEK